MIEAIRELGDAPPRLRLDLNAGNLLALPEESTGPRADDYVAVRAAGYEGLQAYGPNPAALAAGLKLTGMARILAPEDAEAAAARIKGWGFEAATLHVGDGFESDAEIDALAGAILEAQAKHILPMFVETHRATITQDMRRTLDLAARFPDLRFNADLSHWYTGQEMVYGDLAGKFDRLAPVLSRVRFLHGRIGNSCTMQAPLTINGERPDYVDHFVDLWTRCFRGFRAVAARGDVIVFAPELLPAEVRLRDRVHMMNYAHINPDGREETDRWTEALRLCRLAEEAWAASAA